MGLSRAATNVRDVLVKTAANSGPRYAVYVEESNRDARTLNCAGDDVDMPSDLLKGTD